jgi:hypothetical protein
MKNVKKNAVKTAKVVTPAPKSKLAATPTPVAKKADAKQVSAFGNGPVDPTKKSVKVAEPTKAEIKANPEAFKQYVQIRDQWNSRNLKSEPYPFSFAQFVKGEHKSKPTGNGKAAPAPAPVKVVEKKVEKPWLVADMLSGKVESEHPSEASAMKRAEEVSLKVPSIAVYDRWAYQATFADDKSTYIPVFCK